MKKHARSFEAHAVAWMGDERAARGGFADAPELFWVDGGPGDAALRRLRVAPLRGRASAVAAGVALFAWLPLLVLAGVDGVLVGGTALPFLHDLAVHVRFLVAVPLLVLADLPIGAQLDRCTAQFIAADLVRAEDRPVFAGLLVEAHRTRDSGVAALIVITAAYVSALGIMALGESQAGGSWHDAGSPPTLTLAGRWFALVSLPLFHFVLYRWVHRLFVWGRFLRRVSRLELRLTATHPDRAGGLGFLGDGLQPWGILVFATSTAISSAIATRILFAGATLEQYHSSYIALLVLTLVIVIGPLFAVVPALLRLRSRGLFEHGALASHYTQQFEAKWFAPTLPSEEPLLGTSDVQALADLAADHDVVRSIRPVPLGRREALVLVLVGLLPALPLAATTSTVRNFLQQALRLFL
ncbi:hypothetical protein [Nannocystis sp. SCPEA4]|uniref:hypothetical protein n=1 Tax=Nannocystis sp. SCPEA4 TaxID=2996787 RepID=UPI00226F7AF4|nr:hypothetical protein [Nannocystis sp. SCPEA4]MCY1056047.1 hypothetical protein [Nannocystis sp. SCPEA4]